VIHRLEWNHIGFTFNRHFAVKAFFIIFNFILFSFGRSPERIYLHSGLRWFLIGTRLFTTGRYFHQRAAGALGIIFAIPRSEPVTL